MLWQTATDRFQFRNLTTQSNRQPVIISPIQENLHEHQNQILQTSNRMIAFYQRL